MKRKAIWRGYCGAILGLACLIFASRADAIELFRPIPLPDDGRGSTARGVNGGIVVFLGVRDVVGSKITANGGSAPMTWAVNLMSGAATGTELPLPMGAEGEAMGGATFPNGDRVVVGTISQSGSYWGVLWRKTANGPWSPPELLCQDAQQSWVSRAHYCGDDVGLAVAGTAFENGRWLAVLHIITSTDVVTVDLPSPPGSNAAALGLYCEEGITWAVGWVNDRQGRMRPVLWANSGQGWTTSLIELPSGVQGQANDVTTIAPGVWAICGDAMRAGRMLGFTATVDGSGHQTSQAFLQPLDGFANSQAKSYLTNLGGGLLGIFGTSSDLGGTPVASGWIGGSPFAAQQLLSDPGSVAEVRGALPNDSSFGQLYGEIVAIPGAQPQACVFTPSNTHVPDRINLVLGNILNDDAVPSILWQKDDAQPLRIRTEPSAGMRKAVVDLQFTPLTGPSGASSLQYNLIARAEGNQPGAGGTLNVYAFDLQSQTWAPVGSFPLMSVYSGESGALDEAMFVNPQNGAVRLRLEFIANGSRPTALVCDQAAIVDNNSNSARRVARAHLA